MNKRGLIFKIGTVALLIGIAVLMFFIGRGHTVYIDNKTVEYDGQSYKAFNKAVVYVDGERIAKLATRERGKATVIGQKFTMTLELTREKGGETETMELTYKLPRTWDGIVISLPAYLNDLPEDIWMTEFIAQATEEEAADEEIITDEFALGDV